MSPESFRSRSTPRRSVVPVRSSHLRRCAIVISALAAPALFALPARAQATAAVRPASQQALVVEPEALSFLVMGDWGRHGEYHQRDVARAMDRAARVMDAAFIVATGDNFYPNGVSSIDDPAWRASFEDVYTGHALQADWYVVLGNHDYKGSADAQLAYAARSRRWHMPARYYSVRQVVDDTTAAELFFLDTNPFIREYHAEPGKYHGIAQQDTAAQRRWLDSSLTASTATWKIVVGHHHVYSGGKRDTNADLEGWLVPMLERHKVAAYFCGHEHVLQHIVRPGGTVHYFISGAGSETRSPGNATGTRYSEGRSGFMAVSLTPRAMRVQAIDFTGQVRYTTLVPHR